MHLIKSLKYVFDADKIIFVELVDNDAMRIYFAKDLFIVLEGEESKNFKFHLSRKIQFSGEVLPKDISKS